MWQIGRSGETSTAERKRKRELLPMLTKMHFFYDERSKDGQRKQQDEVVKLRI